MLAVVRAVAVLFALLGLLTTSEQTLPLSYNQGIARVDNGWIVSGTHTPLKNTDVLARVDDDFKVVTEVKPVIPQPLRARGYNHVGDIDVVGDTIYAPLEQPDFELGEQVTARFAADTLRFVDSVTLSQHENSFVTIDPDTMTAYTMDRFDGDALLKYDVANNWAPLPPLKLTTTLHHTQGADIAAGSVWISTSDEANRVYRVDLKTGDTTRAGTLGHVGAEGEGIDATPTAAGRFTGLVNDLDASRVQVVHLKPAEDDGNRRWVTVVAVVAAGALVVLIVDWAWRRRRSRP